MITKFINNNKNGYYYHYSYIKEIMEISEYEIEKIFIIT